MGYVSWDDFTQHVLRAGKTHLKPVTVGRAALEFKKAAKTSQSLPARNMWYLGVEDRLLVFENGSSSVRIFDGNLDQVARFEPLSALARSRALKDSAILPYYGKRAKERAFVIPTTDRDTLCAKACVLAVAYLPPKKQVVVSTSDGTLTYWNTAMDYLYGHSIAPGPQVRHSIFAFEPTFKAVVLTRKYTPPSPPSSPLLSSCRVAQSGLLYCGSIDMLLTWQGNMQTGFNLWDIHTHTLLYRFNVHTSHIHSVVEVCDHCTSTTISSY
jgi:hypothetical protein